MLKILIKKETLEKILKNRDINPFHKVVAREFLPIMLQAERRSTRILDPATWFTNPNDIVSDAIHITKSMNLGRIYGQVGKDLIETIKRENFA